MVNLNIASFLCWGLENVICMKGCWKCNFGGFKNAHPIQKNAKIYETTIQKMTFSESPRKWTIFADPHAWRVSCLFILLLEPPRKLFIFADTPRLVKICSKGDSGFFILPLSESPHANCGYFANPHHTPCMGRHLSVGGSWFLALFKPQHANW